MFTTVFHALTLACALYACTSPEVGARESSRTARGAYTALEGELDRIDSAAAVVDRIFQPLPLLGTAEEAALRRYSNAQHLARARSLGIPRELSEARIAAFREEGRLVVVDNTRYWVVRDLDRSQALAVPAVRAALTEIGERFQARLASLGAPPFRLEVSSVLRTSADQAALRRVNPNAATGESTHEYGTTFDVLYSAYSAPAEPFVQIGGDSDASTGPLLRRYADVAAERVAGRRAHELKAILGRVLVEMQNEGRILVTVERLQPVYHVTVARAR